MSNIDDLRALLGSVHTHVEDAGAHAARARALLEEARAALVDAQAVPRPWLPSQLPQALDELSTQAGRLGDVRELLDSYQARL